MTQPTLSCEEVMARLFAYLDGELDEADRMDVEIHMERCRACFTRAEFERRLKERIVETATAPTPRRLRERILMLIARF